MQQTLRVSDLANQTSGTLWVLNSAHDVIDKGGDVTINIRRKDSSDTPISIPKTWVPIEITAFAPFREILDSSRFLDACRNGLITLITNEYAQQLLNQAGASEELARLRQRVEAARASISNRALGRNVTISGGLDEPEDAPTPTVIPKRGSAFDSQGTRETVTAKSTSTSDLFAEDAQPSVSANFISWVSKLNEVDEGEAISLIRSRGQLSVAELEYLHANILHGHIKTVLAKKLPA